MRKRVSIERSDETSLNILRWWTKENKEVTFEDFVDRPLQVNQLQPLVEAIDGVDPELIEKLYQAWKGANGR